MISYYSGSVFNTDAKAIVNTINCTGVMGAGLALEFKLRYTDMYDDYSYKCKNHMIKVGNVYYYQSKDITIVNFPTKDYFKYPSKIEWIESGLKNFVSTYKQYGIKSVAFPKLGTLNGGLEWNQVKLLMEKYLSMVDADVYICLDNKKEAEGLEKQMVDYYNENFSSIMPHIKRLSEQQKTILKNALPLSRFWHLSTLDKIGITTYCKIYTVCKDAVENNSPQQISLFDI